MSSNRVRVLIIGGGLSGLYAAWSLQNRGFRDFMLVEARERTGGRIATGVVDRCAQPDDIAMHAGVDRFDLGPTWFWPDYQREFDQLLKTLGLERYPQFETGHTLFDRSAAETPSRMEGYASQPTSMRLAGGMQSLVDALENRIDTPRMVSGRVVRRISRVSDGVEVDVMDAQGTMSTWKAKVVLLAVPPRLAAATIQFDPPLPDDLAEQWRQTSTWMAPHAKYLAVYDDAFWRKAGLSGDARSAVGPMVEIHDASTLRGRHGLFGFIGVPAQVRQRISSTELIHRCRAQLIRLFGPEAAVPRQEFLKDWSDDGFTATEDDLQAPGQHGHAPDAEARSGIWQDHLVGIGSEWSAQFPGYLAGAVEAGQAGVDRVLSLLRR